jgi:tetratricopeptide (TPR) repeat protein
VRACVRSLVVLLVASSALSSSGRIEAQRRATASPPPAEAAPDPSVEARERFMAGAELFDEERFDAAAVEFERSFALRPVPVVLFNLAQCYRRLLRHDDAIEAFRRYLALGGASIAADRRRGVEQEIAAIEAQTGAVALDVSPAGARVSIDGRPAGAAPLPELRLAEGHRALRIEAEGYVTIEDELVVVGREGRRVEVRLAALDTAATLRLDVTPPAARMMIDGLDVGSGTTERRVPSGGHVIEARLEGHRPYLASVELAERQELALHLQLEVERAREVTEEWWFWTTIGVVVAGGVVAGVVLATNPIEAAPIPGRSLTGHIEI